jgi:hypothetical protein
MPAYLQQESLHSQQKSRKALQMQVYLQHFSVVLQQNSRGMLQINRGRPPGF